jgi:hypothetical protein
MTVPNSPLYNQTRRSVGLLLLTLSEATHITGQGYRNHPYTDSLTEHVLRVRREAEAALKEEEFAVALALVELASLAIWEYQELLP